MTDLGEQLNAAAEEWRRKTYDEHPDTVMIREAMTRPDPSRGRHIGKYVAIAANAGLVVSLFVAEFDIRTGKLTITSTDVATAPEDLPEPFRTLATGEGTGFVQVPNPQPVTTR